MTNFTLIEPNSDVLRGRAKWRYRGQERPDFAHTPGPGQRSVWDFPRPPAMEQVAETVRVEVAGEEIARTDSAVRVLETAGAPTYYLPPDAVDAHRVRLGPAQSLCEWKGVARRVSVGAIVDAGWVYAEVFPEFADIALWFAFYPGAVDCFVGAERVQPQPGGYYGGWVTVDLCGPIKGEPGSAGW